MLNQPGEISGIRVITGLDKCEFFWASGEKERAEFQKRLQEIVSKSKAFAIEQHVVGGHGSGVFIHAIIFYAEKDKE